MQVMTNIKAFLRRRPLLRAIFTIPRKLLFEPLDAGDVVFLGDSLTGDCPWSELFENRHLKNRGIGGDTTQGVLDRLNSITKAKPSKIFLMIGINDLANGFSESAILDNYRQILLRIMEGSPETSIYVQSILPTNALKGHNHEVITALNSRLSQTCNELGANFIDLYSRFVKDRHLNEAYTYDGLHLNGSGYHVWKEAIAGLV
jgi:lysophospholipase L1-like esterase